MSDELTDIQCPNCRHYKTYRGDGWYQPATQRLTTHSGWESVAYGLGALAVLLCAWAATFAKSTDLDVLNYSCWAVPLLALAFGIIAELFRRAGMRNAVRWTRFRCGNCNFQWQWIEGQAWPYPWTDGQQHQGQQTQQFPGYPPPGTPTY